MIPLENDPRAPHHYPLFVQDLGYEESLPGGAGGTSNPSVSYGHSIKRVTIVKKAASLPMV